MLSSNFVIVMLGDAALVLLVAAAVDGRVFLYQTCSHRVALGRLSRLPGFYCGGIFIAVLVYSKSKRHLGARFARPYSLRRVRFPSTAVGFGRDQRTVQLYSCRRRWRYLVFEK